MELTCKQCGAKFRAAVKLPLTEAVRVACPSCANQMVLKPRAGAYPPPPAQKAAPASAPQKKRKSAVIADEPRPFRDFLGQQLKKVGFDPATASAPFVATLVDVTGLVIYFSVALLLLRGTLL